MQSSGSGDPEVAIAWEAATAAALVLWTIPAAIAIFSQRWQGEETWQAMVGGFVALAAVSSFCAAYRRAQWIVVVWLPVFAWICLGAGAMLLFGLAPIHEDLTGLIHQAALGALGLAIFLGIFLAVCAIWRPRTYPLPLVVLAIVNTIGLSAAVKFAGRAPRLDLIVHIVDPSGKPVSGASLTFERFGYGNGGTDVLDGTGGPLISRDDGVVVIPSRRMRYEIRGTITKPGHREVRFSVGMQFNKSDTFRTVEISTRETGQIAYGSIASTDPLNISLYLPPQTDAPDPLHPVKTIELKSNIGPSDTARRFLNVETGEFSTDPADDLRFELFFEWNSLWQSEEPKLRIIGLNGTQVLQVTRYFSFSGGLLPYEHVYQIAPDRGYQDAIVMQGSRPTIYVRARNGRLYARMEVEATAVMNRTAFPLRGFLHLNATGDRRTELLRRE